MRNEWNVFEKTSKGQETNREADPDRLHSYERNLACRLGGPGIALQAALSLAKEGYQEMGSGVEHAEKWGGGQVLEVCVTVMPRVWCGGRESPKTTNVPLGKEV